MRTAIHREQVWRSKTYPESEVIILAVAENKVVYVFSSSLSGGIFGGSNVTVLAEESFRGHYEFKDAE